MNSANAPLQEVLAALPDYDKEKTTGRLTGPDPQAADQLIERVLAGGRASLAALVDLLVEAGQGDDWRARYLLHAIALYVCRKGKDAQRQTLVEALLAVLGGAKPKEVQNHLIREVQAVAGKEAVAKLATLVCDEATSDAACAALTAIGAAAAEPLRKALGQAQGKCKLNVVQALGTLGDAAAAPALRQAAADQDQAVRVAAAMSLAKIGDAASAELLLKTADAEQGYARAEATDACLRLAERLAGSGQRDAAAKIYRHLASTRTDPTERYLRDAAQAALK